MFQDPSLSLKNKKKKSSEVKDNERCFHGHSFTSGKSGLNEDKKYCKTLTMTVLLECEKLNYRKVEVGGKTSDVTKLLSPADGLCRDVEVIY